MPLPDGNTPWPPRAWGDIYQSYAEWDAWYSGDVDRLTRVYSRAAGYAPDPHPSQFRGGMVGRVSRWFWGTPQRQVRSTKLHVPAAADVAGTSADLLFAEPPAVRVDDPDTDQATQDRLDDLFDEGTIVTLLSAAETASAMSGVFLRVSWDQDVADRPLLSAVPPDCAVPVFRWGRLVEVTFTRTLDEDDGQVTRHLEHHAPGVVQHGLYVGDRDNLGRMVPLTERPETANLAGGLTEDGVSIPTGLDRLDVVYVPNALPNRQWRNHPVGVHLGRSDLAAVTPLLDALDETYTSWMRDVRLAKARLIVPDSYLETGGRGQGAYFDIERELFTPLNMLGGKDTTALTANQFAIRVAEHSQTASELWEKIVRGAGYSAQTFGLTSEIAMTAQESNARERKTLLTRGKKVRLWRMAIARAAELMLAVDRQVFHTSVTPQAPSVEFPPAITQQPKERADTVNMLAAAEAASTDTKVRMVHPDWSDDQVDAEVGAIQSEQAAPPPMVP